MKKEIVINYSDRKAFYRDNEINLIKTESDILEILSMNSGRIFSKEDIYEKLWRFDKDGDSSIITEHVIRIRMKLAKYTDDTIIETVWE